MPTKSPRTRKFKHTTPALRKRGFSYNQQANDRARFAVDSLPTDEARARFSSVEYNEKIAAISIETVEPQVAVEQLYVNRYETDWVDEDDLCGPEPVRSTLDPEMFIFRPPFLKKKVASHRFASDANKMNDRWWEWGEQE